MWLGTYCSYPICDHGFMIRRMQRAVRSIIFKGDVVSDIHKASRLQIECHQEQDQMQIRNTNKLSAALFLALFLISGFAHADDSALIREANVALSQKDYSGAFSRFSILAEHGNAKAQFNLGAFYLNGQGVQRDEKQAYEWFAKSAVQGNARALEILRNAAAKGNENAKSELNKIQQQTPSLQTQSPVLSQQASPAPGGGKNLWTEANAALAQKDYNTAFPKFLVLAQQGDAIAQFNVGAFYFSGLGVQKDEKQAYDWFAKSAAQGNARAINVMQSAAAKADENRPTQSTVDSAPSSKPDVKAQADAKAKAEAKAEAEAKAKAKAKSRARSERWGKSSSPDFSLGVSLGQTGKLEGIDNSTSLGLLAGYKINSSFGVEVAYNSLYRNAKADSYLSGTGTFDLTAFSVVGQYTYPLNRDLFLLGNLGFHTSSFKITSSGSNSSTGSSKGVVAGIKVQYDLSERIGIRGGFDTYTQSGGITGSLTEVGIAVIAKF